MLTFYLFVSFFVQQLRVTVVVFLLQHMNYTLGVLLPEFIARVVMSIYKENKEDAMKRIKDISIFLSDIQFEEF